MVLFPIECINTLTDVLSFGENEGNDDEQNILLINLDRIQILIFYV